MDEKNEARDVKMGILKKLGVEYTDKISDERLDAKVSRALEKAPDTFKPTPQELTVIKALGFDVDEEPAPAKGAEKPANEEKRPSDEPAVAPKKKSKAPAEEKPATKPEAKEAAPEEKPAPKKGPKAAPAKKEKGPRMTRFKSVCTILKKRKNHTVAQIVEESDELFSQHGGRPNQKEALGVVNRVLVTLVEMEIVTVTDDNKVQVNRG